MAAADGSFTNDSIIARDVSGNLPAAAEHKKVYSEQMQAATVTVEGQTYAMVVLLDILHGHRRDLAAVLGVVAPQFEAGWHTYDVVASKAIGFWHEDHLIVCHADILPVARPWKHIPLTA